jgi:putative transposase
MSREDNCWDKAVMERFVLSLKIERYGGVITPTKEKRYATSLSTSLSINKERLHSKLGYATDR